jgi:hypothetical protein
VVMPSCAPNLRLQPRELPVYDGRRLRKLKTCSKGQGQKRERIRFWHCLDRCKQKRSFTSASKVSPGPLALGALLSPRASLFRASPSRH